MKPQPETKQIILMRVPGHTGIKENELADQHAKMATINATIKLIPGPTYVDLKKQFKEITNNNWRSMWKQYTTKLNTVKKTTKRWINSLLKNKEESILNQMGIGHTRLTNEYLMAKEEAPLCVACGVRLTVKHIITECLK